MNPVFIEEPMTITTYISTNNSLQAIDTINLPVERSVEYTIEQATSNSTYVSYVTVTHDGLSITESQKTITLSNIQPIEYTTGIVNSTGQVYVQPQSNSTFVINRTASLVSLYSENTVSGRKIKSSEGVGLYLEGSANNMSIRQNGNFYFGNSALYLVSNSLGPIKTKSALLSNSATSWQSYNGSSLSTQDDYIVIASSGQLKNSMYQEINVIPGTIYRLTGNAYQVANDIYAKQVLQGSIGDPRISIGNQPGATDYDVFYAASTEQSFSIDFIPQQTPIYVNIGDGRIQYQLFARDLDLKELVPFHTYKQSEGTFYINWNTIGSSQTLANLYSYTTNGAIITDSSDMVYINSINCGSQQAINRLAFSYNSDGMSIIFNGNSISTTDQFTNSIYQVVFVSLPNQVVYMNTLVSNSTLIELAND